MRLLPQHGAGFVVVAALVQGCLPGYSFDGSSDAGPGAADAGSTRDATSDVGASFDASVDAGADVLTSSDASSSGDATGACPSGRGAAMIRFDTDITGTGTVSFCIDRYEATNADFNAYLLDPSAPFVAPPVCDLEKNGQVARPTQVNGKDTQPVVNVTFCDAWSYCAWAGKRLCSVVGGGDGGHAADDDTLSNEWDFACRNGPLATDFPYGGTYAGGVCDILDPDAGVDGVMAGVGGYSGCHGLDGGFAQIFDMSGNAAEMDDWATDYVADGDAASVSVHTRGGAFDYGYLRACTDRFSHPVLSTFDDVGFRCCADPAP